MRVVPKVEITDAQLSYSSIAEPSPGEVVYNGSAGYLAGDEVISTSTHKKYASLQGASAVATLSVGSPCVVTWVAHGLISGEPVVFTTAGTLPTGIVSGTTYYALVSGDDTFNVSAISGAAAVAINTTGSSSGVHTAKSNINLGRPLPVSPATKTDWWKEIGYSNRYAMFDRLRNTKSVGTSPMNVIVVPGGRADTIALTGMVDIKTAVITETVGGIEMYSRTIDLVRRRVSDAKDYCFEAWDTASSLVVTNLPIYSNGVFSVTLTSTTGVISLSSIDIGMAQYIGNVQYDAESDAPNFSKFERDDSGGLVTLIPKRSIRKTRQTLTVVKARVPKLLDLREALNAVPAIWFGLDDGGDDFFEPLFISGIYTQWLISLSQPSHAICTLTLEEI